MLKFGSAHRQLLLSWDQWPNWSCWGQTEFNMPVKETVKSVNNNQLLRTYDTEDSFTRRRDFVRLSSSFCLDCVYKQMRRFLSEIAWKFHSSVPT